MASFEEIKVEEIDQKSTIDLYKDKTKLSSMEKDAKGKEHQKPMSQINH